jgi:hypothetical protein
MSREEDYSVCAGEWDSIEAWAESVGMSLEQAHEVGVSQDDADMVYVPVPVWDDLLFRGMVFG